MCLACRVHPWPDHGMATPMRACCLQAQIHVTNRPQSSIYDLLNSQVQTPYRFHGTQTLRRDPKGGPILVVLHFVSANEGAVRVRAQGFNHCGSSMLLYINDLAHEKLARTDISSGCTRN